MERGRPREFNEDEALDAALRVFWRQGYQGASMAALTDAMGLSKPSLYGAFGSKEALYQQALKRYCDKWLGQHGEHLREEEDLLAGLRAFLRSVARMLTAGDLPGGCMVVNSAVAVRSGNLPESIEADIADVAQEFVFKQLRERLMLEKKRRNLPPKIDVDTLVDYIASLMAGMAILARLGVGHSRLDKAIDLALRVVSKEDSR